MEVRPADWRDEWEASWHRARLAAPTLITAGPVVVVDSIGYLAVPVGGQRRGGYISADNRTTTHLVRNALAGHPGFPRVRVHWSTHRSACHVIEWGEDVPPGDDDTVRGQFYGYTAEAIARFAEEMAARCHRTAQDPFQLTSRAALGRTDGRHAALRHSGGTLTARTLITSDQATSCYFRTSVDHPHRKALVQICEPCNESCKHCFVSATKRGDYMPLDQVRERLVPQMAEARVNRVTLTGGEPFMHEDLVEVAAAFHDAGMGVGICTNATMVTDEQIAAFAAMGAHMNGRPAAPLTVTAPDRAADLAPALF